MAPSKTRRSFFVELLSTAAGTWITISGLLGLASAASGCGDDTKSKQDGMVVKYGGPADAGTEQPVVKYGGPPDGLAPKYGALLDGRGEQPVVKYGGPGDMRYEQPVVKYGGPDLRKEGLTTKYGGPFVG